MAATRRVRGPAGGARWAWEEDEVTVDIVERLRGGEALETRQFLKPVFRCVRSAMPRLEERPPCSHAPPCLPRTGG